MQDVDVLFLVEHVHRELDVVACLIQKLKSRHGISAVARGYYHEFCENLTLRPRVVVFPFFYGADHVYPIEYATRWPNAGLANLGWEQILNKVDIAMKIPRDDTARNKVFHICWTHKHSDFLATNGVPRDHLLLAGNPVMKLYEEPYKHYFNSRRQLAERYGLDVSKKWVLFPESYQFAFFSDEHLLNLAEWQNADIAFMRQAKEYSERSLRQLFLWINELRADDPLFIMRPRPSTGESEMHNFLRQSVSESSANVKIIKSETAREWILAADHVISSHSTTLIEAALAGKAVHRFSPEAYPAVLALRWHELVPLLDSREALLEAIRDSALEPKCAGLADWARAQFLWAGDPFDQIADSLARLCRTDERRQSPPASAVNPEDYRSVVEREGIQPEDVFDEAAVVSRVSRWRGLLNGKPPPAETEPRRRWLWWR